MIKVGIDIGNSKISLIVCDIKSDGSKKVSYFVSNPTNNVTKSSLHDFVSIKEEVKKTISEAEKESQTEIKSIN